MQAGQQHEEDGHTLLWTHVRLRMPGSAPAPQPPHRLCPVGPSACLSPWLLASGYVVPLPDFGCCSARASWATQKGVSSKKSGKGLAVEKCLALSFPSFQFLAAWGQGTPCTAGWEATVQELEN